MHALCTLDEIDVDMIDVRKLSRVLETRVYELYTPFQNNVIVCPSYHIKMS